MDCAKIRISIKSSQGSFTEVHLAECTSIWNEENAEVPGSEMREVKKILREYLELCKNFSAVSGAF
jgi:hypothetical protein